MKRTLFVLAFACAAIGAQAQAFFEGFETGPAGWVGTTTVTFGNTAGGDPMPFASGLWHARNNSLPLGGTGWFDNPAVFAAHSGTELANANFNNTTGTNTIDNYMMSPMRTFNNGDLISFWTRTIVNPFFPDRLILKLSTAGASTLPASFSTTLLTVNPTLSTTGYPSVWTQFGVTLSGLGGPSSGRFAFNYNVTNGGPSGANSDFIGIDTVTYTPVPEPATLIGLGIATIGLLARRRRT